MTILRCEIHNGGIFIEHFEKTQGWQEKVREWAKKCGKSGDTLRIWQSISASETCAVFSETADRTLTVN